MENTPSTTPEPQKEIDLLSLVVSGFSSLAKGLRQFFRWLKKCIQMFFLFVMKYFWVLALCGILGLATGWFKTRLSKPFYESEMLVETKIVPRSQIADRINNLQQYITDKNYQALARQLNLSSSDVQSIFFLKVDIVNVKVERPNRKKNAKEGEEVIEEEEVGPQFLRIRVRLWDNKKITKLESAFINFVSSDSYINHRLRLAKENNLIQQEAIRAQIAQLELFQKKNIEKSSNIMTSGNTPLVVQNEEKTYVQEILALQSSLADLKTDYELTQPISVVQPFVTYENPVDRRLYNMLLFGLLFFCLGVGVLLIREGWRRV